ETALAVQGALDVAAHQQREGRVLEALAAARQAAWLADSGCADEALRQRVHDRRADRELLADLGEARLDMASVSSEGNFDLERMDQLYAAAFQKAGLHIDALPVEVAAERIQRSSVRAEMAAVLDHWAMTRQYIRGRSPQSWKSLLQVARVADPDE